MPKVKAAVLERSRRSTAGKRMQSLVGKAQEDDDTFWSHSIWSETGGGFSDKGSRKRRRQEDGSSSSASEDEGGNEDDGSSSDGEGSYRMSDEDSEAAVDQFDSDFDESESDDDQEEIDGEGEEERELRAEERREKASKRKKNQRLGMPMKSSAGRELMKKKAGKMTKRGPLGTGWNEGLVLNWPPPPSSGGVASAPAAVGTKKSSAPIQSNFQSGQSSTSMAAVPPTQPQHVPSKPASIDAKLISTAPLAKSNLGIGTAATVAAAPTKVKPPSPKRRRGRQKGSGQTTEKKKSKKQRTYITQEEMIIESIQSTETENSKWLSGRKRMKEEAVQLEKAHAAKKSSAKENPVFRFHSRRGCANTFTFMDMDHLPDILTRRHDVVGHPSSRRGSVGFAAAASSTKRQRLDDGESAATSAAPGQTSSATAASTASTASKTSSHEKCFITGKIARYRDPKTLLGYHDIDAYKELKRRLEAGEIKIPQQKSIQNHGNGRSGAVFSGTSSNRWSAGRKNGTINKTHFPFGPNQPTMVANILSPLVKKPIDVKVLVTLRGVPVPPPPQGDKKKLLIARNDAEMKFVKKQHQQQRIRVKQEASPLKPPIPVQESNTSNSNVAIPETITSELQTAFFNKPAAIPPVELQKVSVEQPSTKGNIDPAVVDGNAKPVVQSSLELLMAPLSKGNNCATFDGNAAASCLQPKTVVAVGTAVDGTNITDGSGQIKAAADIAGSRTLIGTEMHVESTAKQNGGGSNEKKSKESSTDVSRSSTNNTGTTTATTTNTDGGGNSKGGPSPKLSTSNSEKLTTIEAN